MMPLVQKYEIWMEFCLQSINLEQKEIYASWMLDVCF